jgi:hypothetical protein
MLLSVGPSAALFSLYSPYPEPEPLVISILTSNLLTSLALQDNIIREMGGRSYGVGISGALSRLLIEAIFVKSKFGYPTKPSSPNRLLLVVHWLVLRVLVLVYFSQRGWW